MADQPQVPSQAIRNAQQLRPAAMRTALERAGPAMAEDAGAGGNGAPRWSNRVPGQRGSAPQPLRVLTEAVTPSRLVVRVAGEIDVATVPALAEELGARLRAAQAGTALAVDLTAVTFVDARGLATLAEAAETARAAGVDFELVNRPTCLVRLEAVTALHRADPSGTDSRRAFSQ
jgi:anti-sigma B factor antagonist